MLRAEGLSREFYRETGSSSRFVAVKPTDLTLDDGTLTMLTGRSGSGKTTLLNMICGLLQPTTGKVLLNGEDICSLPDSSLSKLRGERIGIIPQGQTALHSLTVMENVLLSYKIYGEPPKEAEEAACQLLERLDILQLRDVMPRELSGGELRRMAIARALVRKPGLILADEPTGDLDDENTREVFTLLRDCAKEGAAVLIVTHESDAGQYADRVLKMSSGELELS